MQIEAGRKQAGPRVRGVWLRETPRPQVPSVTFAMGAERQKGRSERSLPAEPLPRFRLPSGCRTTSGLFSAGGLGGEAGLKPAPSGLCQAPPPPPPPSAAFAAHRWFSAPEGEASALLCNNRTLRAETAPRGRRGPGLATPPSGRPLVGPWPARPPALHPGTPAPTLIAGHCLLVWPTTLLPAGSAELWRCPSGLPALLGSQGVSACTPLILPGPATEPTAPYSAPHPSAESPNGPRPLG